MSNKNILLRDDDNNTLYPVTTVASVTGLQTALNGKQATLDIDLDPNEAIYRIDNHELAAKYDENSEEIANTYVTKYRTVNGHALSSNVTVTKSDVGLGNVDNTSDTAKKTAFTGSIASGNTGFVTGGDIYTALAAKLDASKCTYQTSAPTAAISDGGVHIVYLAAEPGTKYDGYIYLIEET